jgi:exodeoxyribonuclease V alpha subunit
LRNGVRNMKCSFTRLLYPKTLEESQNESYTIALFRPREAVLDGDGQKIASFKAVGYYLPLTEKVTVDMAGHWRKDPKYGLQFEMESYEDVVESGRRGMIAYLSSGLIKGIGPKLAGRIYDTFGEETLDILDRDPSRINEVPGISARKCARFAKAYVETRGARKIINLLAPLDVSAAQSIHLCKVLGLDAEGILRRQPYSVFEQNLISFDLAERLAAQNHIPRTAPERVDAALLYTLHLAEQKGHICLHKERFIQEAVRILSTPTLNRMAVAERAFEMLKARRLALYRDHVYRPVFAEAEQGTAAYIQEMLSKNQLPYMGDLDEELDQQEELLGLTLAEEQRHAVKTALAHPLSIITGGPGTGKTLIQRVLLNIYAKAFPDARIVCCAPTGRAARRMEQSTGFFASTVHKALGLTSGERKEDAEPPEILTADLVLVDEVSMLDMMLTWYLIRALPLNCRLILIGDADQLPSVGPGAVFSELLACGKIPQVRLDRVFRQDEGSRIAENAKLIRHGQTDLDYGDDFQFWSSPDMEQSAGCLEQLYIQEVQQHGLDNVVLLTPFRKKTATGAQALNQSIQARLNPPAPDKPEVKIGKRIFRLGDKVMQIKNRMEVSNGDTGYIRKIENSGDDWLVEVDFGEERVVDYADAESIGQLELAYAQTIHKSQGSEYDSVLISIQHAHGRMLKRPLVYTAITRAKRRVSIVGDLTALKNAIQTTDTERRGTQLAARVADR